MILRKVVEDMHFFVSRKLIKCVILTCPEVSGGLAVIAAVVGAEINEHLWWSIWQAFKNIQTLVQNTQQMSTDGSLGSHVICWSHMETHFSISFNLLSLGHLTKGVKEG